MSLTLSNILTQLAAGRDPQWKEEPDPLEVPTTAPDDGVVLGNVLVAIVQISLRETDAYRTVYGQITGVDDTADYTVTLGSVDGSTTFSVTYSAQTDDTAEDIAQGVADQVNADADTGNKWTATADGDTFKIIGDDWGIEDYSFQVSTSTGTAKIDTSGDAVEVDGQLHFFSRNKAPGWSRVRHGFFPDVDHEGDGDRINVGGIKHLSWTFDVHEDAVVGEPGTPQGWIAPCDEENDSDE